MYDLLYKTPQIIKKQQQQQQQQTRMRRPCIFRNLSVASVMKKFKQIFNTISVRFT